MPVATTTNSNRIACKQLLFNLFRNAPSLAEVDVRYSPPMGPINVECIFPGDIKGVRTVAGMKADRIPRDDRFTIEVHVLVQTNGTTDGGQSTDTRCEIISNVVDDLLADDPKLLGNTPGLLWAEFQGDDDGPNLRALVNENGQQIGWQSEYRCTVGFRSRYI